MVERRLEALPFILDADLVEDRLTLPIGRPHPQMGALSIFLAVWAVASIGVAIQMTLGNETPLADNWGLMAGVWLFLAFFLAARRTGRETLQFDETHLELTHKAFGRGRRRLFRLAEIQHVALEPSPPWVISILAELPYAIRFNYRGRKVLLLPRLSEAQAEVVAGWIRKHLPDLSPEKKCATE